MEFPVSKDSRVSGQYQTIRNDENDAAETNNAQQAEDRATGHSCSDGICIILWRPTRTEK